MIGKHIGGDGGKAPSGARSEQEQAGSSIFHVFNDFHRIAAEKCLFFQKRSTQKRAFAA